MRCRVQNPALLGVTLHPFRVTLHPFLPFGNVENASPVTPWRQPGVKLRGFFGLCESLGTLSATLALDGLFPHQRQRLGLSFRWPSASD